MARITSTSRRLPRAALRSPKRRSPTASASPSNVVMMVLSLVRNYLPSHKIAAKGGWNIADCVSRSYDLEGMQFGTVAAGRIGSAVLRRLKPFDVGLHYTDRHRLPPEVEQELGATFHPDA